MMKERIDQLSDTLQDFDSVLILPHNDPDPDSIASAVALRYLLTEACGKEAQIVYSGIIGRVENKALVRYLDYPLRHLTRADLRNAGAIALVDTQPATGNNPLPAGVAATIVLDHHPLREETAGVRFADVRPELGATSTILTGYLQTAGIEPPAPLATALFYGIKTDTMGLVRSASPDDVEAFFFLQPRVDVDALLEIERAQVPAEFFQQLSAALHSARVYDEVVISYVGPMRRPDLAAELADLLMRLHGAQWVICMGVYKHEMVLAVRTRNRRGGAGGLAQDIVGDSGTAGGHGTMAGGHITLGNEHPEQIAQRIRQRALSVLNIAPESAGTPLIE
jgi:nanoRNase/pAp phosphatase (c-di-AMP/oligoRNAs hydrolase)